MIVVTGATGHIGNVLVRELLREGERVRALIGPSRNTAPLEGLDVEKVEGDVRDLNSLLKAFKGAHLVYHLAAEISTVPGRNKLLQEVNVEGTKNVMEACLKSGVKRLIYTSSVSVFSLDSGKSVHEDLFIDPHSLSGEYDKSKAFATLEVLKGTEKGLDAVIVCPTGVIGPYDFKPSEMGRFILDFLMGKIKAYVEGAYDFVDVRDVARGHVLAASRGQKGGIYILSGERLTIGALLSMLEEVTGIKAPSLRVPKSLALLSAKLALPYYSVTGRRPRFTPYVIRTITSNIRVKTSKAREELGYSPRPLKESIRDTVKWFRYAFH